jgi:hypothetical protein
MSSSGTSKTDLFSKEKLYLIDFERATQGEIAKDQLLRFYKRRPVIKSYETPDIPYAQWVAETWSTNNKPYALPIHLLSIIDDLRPKLGDKIHKDIKKSIRTSPTDMAFITDLTWTIFQSLAEYGPYNYKILINALWSRIAQVSPTWYDVLRKSETNGVCSALDIPANHPICTTRIFQPKDTKLL